MKHQRSSLPLRIGIIGSGIAGLAAARTLGELGQQAVVLDKGRGPGGRSSSRRAPPFAFDHGAQYFTARDPQFLTALDSWLTKDVVAPWKGTIVSLKNGQACPVTEGVERFVGAPRMSTLAQHLAHGVEVHTGVRVTSIERIPQGWKLSSTTDNDFGVFDRLIVTAPPQQAHELIGTLSPIGVRAAQVPMQACWAVMIGLGTSYQVPFDGAFCEGSLLSWVSRDSSKPGRPDRESWVLHTSAEWTQAHLETDSETVIEKMLTEFERITKTPLPEVHHRDAHHWRFARPVDSNTDEILVDQARGLVLAGDAYCGGRVEGAYLSGVAAAHSLV